MKPSTLDEIIVRDLHARLTAAQEQVERLREALREWRECDQMMRMEGCDDERWRNLQEEIDSILAAKESKG